MRRRWCAGGRLALVLATALAAGLSGCNDPQQLDVPEPRPREQPRERPPGTTGETPSLPGPCADLHADELLPTFEIETSEADWAALQRDAALGQEVYRPAVFRHGAEVVPDAMIRLRGNNSRCGEKLQFAISFNETNPDARYHGLRRLNLDHGGCNLLEERLALSFLRDLGLPAACANHARLVVNGRYYGLFVNLEHLNKDFLRRSFGPAADDGNLYKDGSRLVTNERAGDTADLAAYRAAADLAALEPLVDLDEAVTEWAAEAVLPARDNHWLHGWNYYLYHHPTRGFLFLPTDLDQAFPGSPAEARLATLVPDVLQPPAPIVLADPGWRGRYEQAVRGAVAAYDADRLAARLERWWQQIAAAAGEDPFASYSIVDVQVLESRVRARAAWLAEVVGDPASW